MSHPVISVEEKKESGKRISKTIRKSGLTPAVVYGGDNEPSTVALDLRDLSKVFHSNDLGRNTIIELDIKDTNQKELVLTHDLMRDPVTDKVIHIDFLRVDDTKSVTVEVPVEFVGTPAGQRFGGILIKTKNTLRVSCQASQIPVSIKVDVSPLQLGESIHLKDLTPDEGIEFLNNEKETIALIQVPREAKMNKGADEGTEEGTEASADSAE